MKGIKKLFWVAAVFAAVFGLAGCDNPSGGGAQSKMPAVYEGESPEYDRDGIKLKNAAIVTFFEDKTGTEEIYHKSGEYSLLYSRTLFTYEGDPNKNGTVTTTVTAMTLEDSYYYLNDMDKELYKPENWHKIDKDAYYLEAEVSLMPPDIKYNTFAISDDGQKATAGGMTFSGMTLTRK